MYRYLMTQLSINNCGGRYGHVIHMDENRWSKRIMEWNQLKKKEGRQRTSWKGCEGIAMVERNVQEDE